MRTLEFRALTERELPILREWLSRPHLQRWWRADERSLSQIRETYLPRNAGLNAAKPFLALEGNRPIGYIQSYCACNGTPDWWPDKPGPGVFGIDQFIADGDQLGQGLGTTMVTQFVHLLMSDPNVTEIRVDPHPDNTRAIRCYSKVGFREIGPISTPDGPAIMMVLKRSQLSESGLQDNNALDRSR